MLRFCLAIPLTSASARRSIRARQTHGRGEAVLREFEIMQWQSCAMGECYTHVPLPDDLSDLCRPTPAYQRTIYPRDGIDRNQCEIHALRSHASRICCSGVRRKWDSCRKTRQGHFRRHLFVALVRIAESASFLLPDTGKWACNCRHVAWMTG